MRTVLFILITFFSLSLNAQYKGYKKPKAKKSIASGTLDVAWGYNLSSYTKSTIQFVGAGYDFKIAGVKAVDRPSKDIKTYFNPREFTVPQFNFRIGYNFQNKWNVSIGYDHMKYVMVHNTPYLLTGRINAGVDNVTNWSGTYAGDSIITNEQTFHYENSNGLNYIRLEFARLKLWHKSRNGSFAFTSLLGGSFGGILSFNDFTFAGRKDVATVSMSGLGVSAHLGGRFEFFQHFFVQMNAASGFMMQSRVKIRPNDYDAYARQRFGYAAGEILVGGLFYIRSKNDCNSCPHW
ncbi:MAG: hypothetical protein EBQ94_12260 [Flavobacteriales bacterium]|nr:hypothetical protein [Flavobacteriales bacterium]NCA20309.1 hypothetical protein [Crocinitomicaceae bacterium]